jgi:L-ribulose-5-phosphate 3-epimerase
MKQILPFSRRDLLIAGGATALLGRVAGLDSLLAAEKRGFPIGICDWSLGFREDPGVFDLARQIGVDGVQVSFGSPDAEHDLRRPDVRQHFAEASHRHNIEICSLGMAVLNEIPYADDKRAEQWVADSIEVMRQMRPNPRIVLLAFFGQGDLLDDRARQDRVIQKLKNVCPAAEKAGVVLGIESWLNVEDHLRILDGVGSSAVQVYYDVANMTQRGYDFEAEIRRLGRERICQIHAKENGHLLGQGPVDFLKLKRILDEIGWQNWLVIEGATTSDHSLIECQQLNRQYLRSVFPAPTSRS